jgi:hypothetical protein
MMRGSCRRHSATTTNAGKERRSAGRGQNIISRWVQAELNINLQRSPKMLMVGFEELPVAALSQNADGRL